MLSLLVLVAILALPMWPTTYVHPERGQVGLRLGRYDQRLPLTIDPVLRYSGYLGGSAADAATAAALDTHGNLYLTGYTASLCWLFSTSVRLRDSCLCWLLRTSGPYQAAMLAVKPICVRLRRTRIGVVETTQDWRGADRPRAGTTFPERSGNLLLEPLMRPGGVEERHILRQDAPQVILAHDQQVVQALPANATKEPLTDRVLFWCPVRCAHLLDAGRCSDLGEGRSISRMRAMVSFARGGRCEGAAVRDFRC